MSRTLILMRHSHAADEHSGSDFNRQLTITGAQLAQNTGRLLKTLKIIPDLIVASAAARTIKTGELLAQEFPATIPIVSCSDLYQAGDSEYLPVVQAKAEPDSTTILTIGHNPGISILISRLANEHAAAVRRTAIQVRSCSEPGDVHRFLKQHGISTGLRQQVLNLQLLCFDIGPSGSILHQQPLW